MCIYQTTYVTKVKYDMGPVYDRIVHYKILTGVTPIAKKVYNIWYIASDKTNVTRYFCMVA